MYDAETTKRQYRSSFTLTGIFAGLAGDMFPWDRIGEESSSKEPRHQQQSS